jgi:hypothetical protein
MSKNDITGDKLVSKTLSAEGRANFDVIFGKKVKNPLEKEIEAAVCQYAKEFGMLVYKFTSPQRAAVPDRIFIRPDGTVIFVEFKRKGQVPTPAQAREHQRLRNHGVSVFVIDSIDMGKAMVDFNATTV